VGADGSYNEKGFYFGFGLMVVLQICALLWYVTGLMILKRREHSQPTENVEQQDG
jgi:hypothetical protein